MSRDLGCKFNKLARTDFLFFFVLIDFFLFYLSTLGWLEFEFFNYFYLLSMELVWSHDFGCECNKLI